MINVFAQVMIVNNASIARALAADDRPDMQKLLADLSATDDRIRLRARRALVSIGRPTVPELIKVLSDSNVRVRWEAAKALAVIGDPTAAPALAAMFEDSDPGVRWLVAQGLASMGRDGIVAGLQAVMSYPDSPWVREGVHYVLSHMANKRFQHIVAPVLKALEGMEPSLSAPRAAKTALEMVLKEQLHSSGGTHK